MALDLGELSAEITLDDRGFTRPMQQAERGIMRLESTSHRSLNRMESEFGEAGRGAARELGRGLDRAADEAGQAGEQAGQRFTRGADGKLRDAKGRFIRAGRDAGEGFTDGAEKKIRDSDLGGAGKKAGEDAGDGLADGVESGGKGKLGAVRGKLAGVMSKAGPWLAAGAVVGGVFMQGLAGAMEKQDAVAKLKASLGATGPEADRLGKAAGHLFAQGYGESMGDVTEALDAVVSSIAGMRTASNADIESMTAKVSDLATAFDLDVSRAAQIAGQTVKAGLVDNAKQGLDLLTATLQHVPKEVREDVIDALDEYSPFFEQVGVKGRQAFNLLAGAADKGAFGIDKTGDALKEFTIRATDMSTSTQAAYKTLGLDTKKVTNDLLAGGKRGAGAFQLIITKLRGIKDPAKRSQAALALFGTPLEDLGTNYIPKFLQNLDATDNKLGKVGGSADRLGKTLHGTASANITKFQRTLKTKLVDLVGGKVLPALTKFSDEVGPKFAKAFGEIKKWVDENQDKIQEWSDKIRQIVTLVGGIISAGLTVIGALWHKFGSTILDTVAGLITGILNYWAGIFTMILGVWNIFAGIFTGDWDRVWKGIKQIFSGAIKAIGAILGIGLTLIKATWKLTWDLIKGVVKKAWNIIVAGVKWGVNKVKAWIHGLASLPGKVGAWFGRMKTAAVSKAQSLANWMKSLPGKIKRALGSTGSMLWNAGRNVIAGMIRGMLSKIGDVGNAVSGIVQKIRDRLPHSPAKEGPLSGSGSPDIAGRKIGSMVAAGITSSRGDVVAAMATLTGPVAAAPFRVRRPGGGTVVRGGDGAQAPVTVVLDVRGGDREFKNMIRKWVRVDGRGDVQLTFGTRRGGA